MDRAGLVERLKRGDAKLLRAIVDSNGGGVRAWDFYSCGEVRFVPKAQEIRLRDAGLVRSKPNHAGFLIHTDQTKVALTLLAAPPAGSDNRPGCDAAADATPLAEDVSAAGLGRSAAGDQ